MRILIVDDEPQIVRALRVALEARGYEVRSAGNAETALELAATDPPDLVILDLGLPGMDGVAFTRRFRSWSSVPILVLSVRDKQQDKVGALDAGADDYLTKPFGMEELLARMRALLRRSKDAATEPAPLRYGALEIDPVKRSVKRDGNAVHLTPTEYDLLLALASNPGKLLTHRWLLTRVWGDESVGDAQYLRVYVGQLRRKLEADPSQPTWLLTEPGLGYRWAETSEPATGSPSAPRLRQR